MYPWTAGALSATNLRSDADPSQSGTKTGNIYADITITNSGAWQTSNPQWAYNNGGMPSTDGFGMKMGVNWTTCTQTTTLTVTFKNASGGAITEYPVDFSIYDINAHVCSALSTNRFIDNITVTGYKTNLTTTVLPSVTSTCASNTVTSNSIKGSGSCGLTKTAFSFSNSNKVARIIITYTSGTGHPASQNCGTAPAALITSDDPKSQEIYVTPFKINPISSLPVEFSDFYYDCTYRDTFLLWETYSEHNNAFFTLYNSTDGENFKLMNKIDGKGNYSGLSEYKIRVTKNDLSSYYYRLDQTDFDGKTIQLKTISIPPNCQNELYETIVYPNPFKDLIYIDLPLKKSPSTISVLDLNGKILYQEFIENNTSHKSISLENIGKGMYLIQIENNQDITIHRIVKNE